MCVYVHTTDQGFTNPSQQVTMVPKNHAVAHIIFQNNYF